MGSLAVFLGFVHPVALVSLLISLAWCERNYLRLFVSLFPSAEWMLMLVGFKERLCWFAEVK